MGFDRVMTFDMGGTSSDCAICIDGDVNLTTDFEVEWGIPVQIPMVDVRTIGAGGGSIAWVDNGGMLQVGPRSAGVAARAGLLWTWRYRGDGDGCQRDPLSYRPQ